MASPPRFGDMRVGRTLGLSHEQPHWPHPQDVALGSHREQLEVIITLGFPRCPEGQKFPFDLAFVLMDNRAPKIVVDCQRLDRNHLASDSR